MKDYTFVVTNTQYLEMTARADKFETAKNKLKSLDVCVKVGVNNHYDLDNAELIETRELPSHSKILSFQKGK